MSTLTDFIAQHDAQDQATQKLLDDTKAALATAQAATAADDLEISKLRANVAVLEQWKADHTTPDLPPPPPKPEGARFPGDPGKGKYMVGLSLGPYGRNSVVELKKLPQWNSKIKWLHDYASAGAKCLDHGSIKEILDAGMLVASQSFKCKGIPANTNLARFQYITAGKNDAEIRLSARYCKTFKQVIWLCFHHEPEDDFTDAATQKEYRLAYRHIVKIFREEGVTNVAFAPIYMVPYTFESSRDFRNWHADWNGTAWESDQMMDLFGMDVYNPLPGGSKNRSFKEMVVTKTEALTKSKGMPAKPKAVFEYGYGRTTADWVAYGNETKTVAASNDVVAVSYWDSSADAGRYSLDTTSDPSGKKAAGWKVVSDGAI